MNSSISKQFKDLVKKGVPSPFLGPAKAIYNRLKPAHVYEIATIYLNRPDVRTYVGVNNFYSWIAPQVVKSATARLKFYSPEGRLLVEHSERLEYFGAANFDVQTILNKAGVDSTHGMFSLKVDPKSYRNEEYKKLSPFKGIFYVLFNYSNGSLGVVHPNSRTGEEPLPPKKEWRSLQVIQTRTLEKLRIYQMMPVNHHYPIKCRLVDNASDKTLAMRQMNCGPFSGTMVEFDIGSLDEIPTEIRIVNDVWPINNAKPLIERVYMSGLTSISHA
jgi:hypothetical protein